MNLPTDINEINPYKVAIEVFEGPFDLLLHLIKKEDLNIYDIPITPLLEKYLEYLNLAKELNIDLAGEFLEMAAELAYLKSKMLLPEPAEEGEEEGPDPRADLMQRLIEYQKYKQSAQLLLGHPLLGLDVFRRSPLLVEEEEGPLIETDTISLLNAFQELLERLPPEKAHEVRENRMGVAEKILELTEQLRGGREWAFEDLFQGIQTRNELVVTFLAILEMAKQRLLRILQDQNFHKIYLHPLFGSE